MTEDDSRLVDFLIIAREHVGTGFHKPSEVVLVDINLVQEILLRQLLLELRTELAFVGLLTRTNFVQEGTNSELLPLLGRPVLLLRLLLREFPMKNLPDLVARLSEFAVPIEFGWCCLLLIGGWRLVVGPDTG